MTLVAVYEIVLYATEFDLCTLRKPRNIHEYLSTD